MVVKIKKSGVVVDDDEDGVTTNACDRDEAKMNAILNTRRTTDDLTNTLWLDCFCPQFQMRWLPTVPVVFIVSIDRI